MTAKRDKHSAAVRDAEIGRLRGEVERQRALNVGLVDEVNHTKVALALEGAIATLRTLLTEHNPGGDWAAEIEAKARSFEGLLIEVKAELEGPNG